MEKKSIYVILILLISVIGTSCNNFNDRKRKSTDTEKKISVSDKVILFNGTFDNWFFQIKDPDVDPSVVFTIVDDSIIDIKGNPFGYMRTTDEYADYSLHVEYRWPDEESNSGVFVHHQLPDNVWPVCIENQLKAGRAGDYVLMNGAKINEADPERVASGAQFVPVAKMAESSEKKAGEWNSLDITCSGNQITTYVNSVLQNKATGASVSKGHICLQSEGGHIQFKNIYLIKLN